MRARYWLAAAILLVLLPSALVAAVWALGWWPTDRGDQWQAVEAISTAVTGLLAAIGLATIWLARAQLAAIRRQTRVQFAPYLRVDLSPDAPGGQWDPSRVTSHHAVARSDLQPPAPQATDLFENWHSDDQVEVSLWITNQQSHPSGAARWVVVDLEFEMPFGPDEEGLRIVEDSVFFHYIEPGRTVRCSLGWVARTIPYLAGSVVALAYSGIAEDALSLGHGSNEFEWDGQRLMNYRNALFGSEDRERGN